MMHKARYGLVGVSHCFSRSSVQFQGHRPKKSATLTLIGRLRTVTPVWIYQRRRNDAWSSIEDVPYSFSRSSVKFQGHTVKKSRFWPILGVSGLLFLFEFIEGYQMMHKAWGSMEEVPDCFSRSSVKFRGHTGHKFTHFDPNWVFPDCYSCLNLLKAMKVS